nr:lipoyl(octanoyl) transferase LipB [Kibdelosporangium sp. MJ126-NF4]CEL17757.1 Octanoate-[acyl-carrier-protein]-protein-N-octanoyltransferase [Kibdelosporangium sp. MJ126-NF4]CTQ91019.1 Octanoate-[acyl-carrier-protein]-protein-N-octanoyltransferase [Kibdelosporangium sp. MJ126-NF4]
MKRIDLEEVPYLEAIEEMRGWVEQRQSGLIEDRLVLLTHPPTITYGARTPPAELPSHGDIPVIPVDRGGQATYHGPGQLVGYLVIDLRQRGPGDVVRWLENGLITALDSLGYRLIRRDTPPGGQSLVGVWTSDHHKIASIGMRIRRGVTSHGFSLNIDSDLSVYQSFVACGLPDVPMTSLAELGGAVPDENTVRDAIAAALDAV